MASYFLHDSEHRKAFNSFAEPQPQQLQVPVQEKVRVVDIDFLPDGTVNMGSHMARPSTLRQSPWPRFRIM